MMNENKKQYIPAVIMVAVVLVVGVVVMIINGQYEVKAEEEEYSTVETKTDDSGNTMIANFYNIMNQYCVWYAPGTVSDYCCYRVNSTTVVVLAKGDSFDGLDSFSTYTLKPGADTVYGTFEYRKEGYYTCDGFGINTSVFFNLCIPKFSSASLAIQYAKGEIGLEQAENWNYLQDSMVTNSYNEDMPRYDKLTITVNSNDTATVTAGMSEEQLAIYQAGFTDSTNPYKLELHNYAIYAKKSQIGIFNDFVLKYGVGTKLENWLPSSKKMDELVTFDENDRLLIHEYAGSGACSKCLYDDVMTISSASYLMASRQKIISPPDGVVATSTYTIDITPASNNIGSAPDTYDLIGFCSVIAITKLDDDGNYIAGPCTYSYSWLTEAMAQRYGNKTESYLPDGTQVSGSSNYFDKSTGEIMDYSTGSSGSATGSIDIDGLLEDIKKGFGLSGTNGYIELARQFFVGIPTSIWILIGTALAVNIIVIIFKALRGM